MILEEIKFRAMTVDGYWVYGLVSISQGKPGQPEQGVYISNKAGMPWAFLIDPKTIGQYVGLNDKNGVHIYTDDILRGNNSGIALVGYVPNHFSLYPEDTTQSPDELIDEMCEHFTYGSAHYKTNNCEFLEIIGNHFDGLGIKKRIRQEKAKEPDSRFRFEIGRCPFISNAFAQDKDYDNEELYDCIGNECEVWMDKEKGCAYRIQAESYRLIGLNQERSADALHEISKTLLQILGQLKTRK